MEPEPLISSGPPHQRKFRYWLKKKKNLTNVFHVKNWTMLIVPVIAFPRQAVLFLACGIVVMVGSMSLIIADWVMNSAEDNGH